MTSQPDPAHSLLISTLTLRRAIGVIGIAFPFVMALGHFLSTPELLASISAYYHTGMRDLFVGALCAIGIFLLCYRGYELKDHAAAITAGIGAIGTALFPTALSANPGGTERLLSILHWSFAAIFLASLAYIALGLFTKHAENPTPEKLQRNTLYRTTGSIMAACLALLLIYYFLPQGTRAALQPLRPVFFLESLAVVSFGVAWLTKGEALLPDKP
jgi:uncharacterized BrkB/YihY/UPF0761 family membrane protein